MNQSAYYSQSSLHGMTIWFMLQLVAVKRTIKTPIYSELISTGQQIQWGLYKPQVAKHGSGSTYRLLFAHDSRLSCAYRSPGLPILLSSCHFKAALRPKLCHNVYTNHRLLSPLYRPSTCAAEMASTLVHPFAATLTAGP